MVSQQKIIAYASIGIAAVGAVAAFGGGNIGGFIGGILAGLGAVSAIILLKYGYLVMPKITGMTKTSVELEGGYEVPPSQDVIVKNSDGVYYASAFLGIKIFESTTEKTQEEVINYNEFFERAISNLKYVTKLAYLVYVEDISEKRKMIETKRAEAQLRLAREKEKPEPDVLRIDKFEREVAVWNLQLNELIKGVKPMGVVAYAMTTAVGVSKEGAMATVKAQANELKSVLANALNVEIDWLTADNMLRCFEWEKFFPITPSELEEAVS